MMKELSEAIDLVLALMDAQEERALTPTEREKLEEAEAVIGRMLRLAFGESEGGEA